MYLFEARTWKVSVWKQNPPIHVCKHVKPSCPDQRYFWDCWRESAVSIFCARRHELWWFLEDRFDTKLVTLPFTGAHVILLVGFRKQRRPSTTQLSAAYGKTQHDINRRSVSLVPKSRCTTHTTRVNGTILCSVLLSFSRDNTSLSTTWRRGCVACCLYKNSSSQPSVHKSGLCWQTESSCGQLFQELQRVVL